MKRHHWVIALAINLTVAVVVAVIAWLWFSPVGAGEYAYSPDGRYHASAYNLSRGTWLHGRVTYIRVQITEIATGRVVWMSERHPLPGETPADFGDRSMKLIQWATDSKSVAVPIGTGVDSVWAVP